MTGLCSSAYRPFAAGEEHVSGLRLLACLTVFFAAGAPACGAGAAEGGIGAAWVVEWDLKAGWEEASRLDGAFSSVQVFAAYFDEKDEPFITDRLGKWIGEVAVPAAGRRAFYLTVVNDVVGEDGRTAALKDPDLITRLVSDPAARDKHIKDLVALLKTGPFSGLELDYERVKPADWPTYLDFCRMLHAELAKAGCGMRVVMEPKKAYLSKPLPAGPEFVLMAYNLHGGGTQPGPKADPAFISRLASYCRAAKIRPFPRLALATGGFSWNSDGTTTGVTENAALRGAGESGAALRRDPYSYYVAYTCADAGKKPAKADQSPEPAAPDAGEAKSVDEREVWFADGKTLSHLLKAARSAGFEKFDVWRLGGNSVDAQDAVKAFFTTGE